MNKSRCFRPHRIEGALTELQEKAKSYGYTLHSESSERPLYAKEDEEITNTTQKWINKNGGFAEIFFSDTKNGRFCHLSMAEEIQL